MGALVLFITITVFLSTLAPGIVAAGDNAELIACAYTLGIAHPPGYPLLAFLGKIFSFIPVGSIATRVNLLSALLGSLSALFVYFSVFKLTKDRVAAITGALALGFSGLFWRYSVTAEVFTLNTFFASLILYSLLAWKETRNITQLYLAAFFFGLGLTNHQTLVFFIPAALFFVFFEGRKYVSLKGIAVMCGLLILGLMFYLYLPLRAATNPAINWMNPDNLQGFLRAITRGSSPA